MSLVTGSNWFSTAESCVPQAWEKSLGPGLPRKRVPVLAMHDADCTAFLQWALPQIDMHWPGFRKAHHQVYKRLKRRINEIGLNDFASYRKRLETDPREWQVLDQCCRITISRFLATVECSTGCRPPYCRQSPNGLGRKGARHIAGSPAAHLAREPYSVRILWDVDVRGPACGVELSIVATDVDAALLNRARDGCYGRMNQREAPPELVRQAFEQSGSRFYVRQQYREGVTFLTQGLRSEAPQGMFDIILCRYVAFTYFGSAPRQKVLAIIAERLVPSGFLVVGTHEPIEAGRFVSVPGAANIKYIDQEGLTDSTDSFHRFRRTNGSCLRSHVPLYSNWPEAGRRRVEQPPCCASTSENHPG